MADSESSSVTVALLVQDAHGLPISPNFKIFLSSNQEVLINLINRQLHILQRRSVNFDDNQITIYDKALLHLTCDGNDLASPLALRFFCEEFLGTDEEDLDDTKMMLDQYSIVPPKMDQASTIVGSQRGSLIKSDLETSPAPHIDTHERDTAYKRLMAVYEQARTEFLSVADNDDNTTVSAAKFLRDTVENVIDSLKDGTTDTDKHAELRTMARMTKDTVEKLCGGKKRKFDCEAGRIQKRSTWPSTSDSGGSQYSDRVGYSYGRPESHVDQRRYARDRSPIRGYAYRRSRSPEIVRLPYGYTRPVDTYYPA